MDAPSVLPTPGVLAEQGTAAAGAAKRSLDPHPYRKVLALPIFTPELQLRCLGWTLPAPCPSAETLCPLAAPPAHRGSSDDPFSATGSSLTFFFP